jgi:addiction module RelB/DinJ family antitoxin
MIMASTNINVRVDSELKANAQDVLGNLGMDLSTAISVYLKQIVYNKAIPFPIAEPKTTIDDEYYLRLAFAQHEAGARFYTLDECSERMKVAIKRGAAESVR